MSMIHQLVTRVQEHSPKSMNEDLPEAGILVPLTRSTDNPEIILTRRAGHMRTHQGQVAFPGGMSETDDTDLLDTALRESHEEIGLLRQQVEIIGPLSQLVSLHGIQVTPYVGLVDDNIDLQPNPDELESIFKVPVNYIMNAEPKRRDRMTYKGMALSVPSYDYHYRGRDYEIWGLSAIVMVELLNVAFDADITIYDEPE